MASFLKNICSYRILIVIAAIGFLETISVLAYTPQQSDFNTIAIYASLSFLFYLLLTFWKPPSIWIIFGLGLFIRAFLCFSFPNLSDDIYRFVWDGRMVANGLNPYGYLPTEVLSMNNAGLNASLFDPMNSPEYYTIYPPFTQFVFYISAAFTDDIRTSSIIIKGLFLIAEAATFFGIVKLLDFLKKDRRLAAIYFLNPLVIVEGVGNLHFEILMVVFLIWAMYYTFVKGNLWLGALLLSLSVASKLLPLMFLPFFLFKMKKEDAIQYIGATALFCILLFLPIAFGLDFANFGKSIDLYFQKFEFNASVYYVLRYFGKLLSGYNLIHYIGPTLGLITVSLILYKARKSKEYNLKTFLEFSLFAFTVYLLLATTIHPWYLIVPIMLTVFSDLRYVILWSGLIFYTYINYSYTPYWENLWVVAFEYGLVFLFYIGVDKSYSFR